MKTPFQLFKNAKSWGLRRKTAKQREGCIRTLHNLTGDATNTQDDPAATTAYWRFDADKKRHEIRLGLKFVDSLLPDAKASERKQYQCAQALILHECWHGHLTERDTKKLADALRSLGIPFALLNLFEDARIEHAARSHVSFKESFDGGRFGWVNYYAQPEASSKPTEVFWALVNGESSSFSSLSVRCPRWTGGDWTTPGGRTIKADDVLPTIKRHFKAVIDSKTTGALRPALEAWLRDFGDKVAHSPRVSGKIGSESDGSGPEGSTAPTGSTGLGGESGHGAGEGNENAPTAVKPPTKELASGDAKLRPATVGNLDTFQNSTIKSSDAEALRDHVGDINEQVSRQVARLVDIVRQAGLSPTTAACDGRKLHIGNAASGQANAFLRNAADRGRRKVVAVFDCSGSMGAAHLNHGRAFLLALVTLHRRGVIDTDIWLTGGRTRCRLNLNAITYRDLVAIAPHHGTESYADTLAAIPINELREASAVLCYTDGQLTDGDVNAGAYRSKGVNLIGCATTGGHEPEVAQHIESSLRRHFGRAITKGTGDQLASAITAYFATRK